MRCLAPLLGAFLPGVTHNFDDFFFGPALVPSFQLPIVGNRNSPDLTPSPAYSRQYSFGALSLNLGRLPSQGMSGIRVRHQRSCAYALNLTSFFDGWVQPPAD